MCYLVLPSKLVFSQTMTNRSLITNKVPFIIQCMIENTLLHLILDTISKQIEQPWQVSQDDS